MVANASITTSPARLVTMLVSTSPARYSEMHSGVAKKLRKLRDHTSSKNAIVTPCMTRIKKSHRRTAPSSDGTKLKREAVMLLRYLVMNPHSTISSPIHTNSGSTREMLPRIR